MTKAKPIRYLMKDIYWNDRLFAIVGARGTGKTTMMLQYIKLHLDIKKALYVSLDDLFFSNNRLVDVAAQLSLQGVTHLFVDEIHKYPYETWAQELKNIYDTYSDLHVVFSGSSMLEIYKGNADLSRRAVQYELRGLSFREFLEFENVIKLKPISLNDLLKDHIMMASDIVKRINPEKITLLFNRYLKMGFYPYYKENSENYGQRVANVINTVLEGDLPAIEKIEFMTTLKIKRLLGIITTLAPFTPNISELSKNVNTTRPHLLKSIDYLERARILGLLRAKNSIGNMSKPEKIYLDNTNIAYALGGTSTNVGNVRETFFFNQLRAIGAVTSSNKGDFVVQEKYTFEVGGAKKT
ncbi:MAG: AAA family ATPase, partial [Prevotellaceae bacterium]|nr:AAA family ATPase [Prevotellaceae bacterium]